MNYLNITKYLYLLIGFGMIIHAVVTWNDEPKPYLSLMVAFMAFIVYFVRNKFAKKFENHKKQNQDNK